VGTLLTPGCGGLEFISTHGDAGGMDVRHASLQFGGEYLYHLIFAGGGMEGMSRTHVSLPLQMEGLSGIAECVTVGADIVFSCGSKSMNWWLPEEKPAYKSEDIVMVWGPEASATYIFIFTYAVEKGITAGG